MEFTDHPTWKFVYKCGPDIAYRGQISPYVQTIDSDLKFNYKSMRNQIN